MVDAPLSLPRMETNMKPITLRALKASIAHWKRNAADPKKAEISASACALCRRFNDLSNPLFCKRKLKNEIEVCPVFRVTGKDSCKGSPYTAFHDAWGTAYDNKEWDIKKLTKLANDEVEFLESLLPKGD